jgi:hypothetical protein
MHSFENLVQDFERILAVASVSEFRSAGMCAFCFEINILPATISSINLAAGHADVQLHKLT